MEGLEATGRTVEEAIEKALNQLGVERDDVDVVVVEKGRTGILGLGSEEARVLVEVREEDTFDIAKETLEELLRGMGVSAAVGLPETSFSKPEQDSQSGPSFEIDGEDAGLLIGRRGESLSALQFILNMLLSRKLHKRVNATIDVEGYRERRYESLRSMANRMAERVAASGRTYSMEAMPARERRIVHIALATHSRVTTESVGEGEDRKVTIIAKRGGRPPGPGRGNRFNG
ncbi:MAG: protein jag [Chloroflexi bacterium]|nr:protein jag [Chloroflexota bacterium]